MTEPPPAPKPKQRVGFVTIAGLLITGAVVWSLVERHLGSENPGDIAPPPGSSSGQEQAARAVQPFVVKIDTSVSGGAFPIVSGRTNLPEGTELMVMVTPCNPDPFRFPAEPHCPPGMTSPYDSHPPDGTDRWPGLVQADDAGHMGDFVTVKDGQFVGHPWFRAGHQGLYEGTYIVEVMDGPDEPPDVQALFTGDDHDDLYMALSGPIVVSKYEPASPRLGIMSPYTVKSINYHRFFTVGPNPADDPVPSRAAATAPGVDPYAADKIAEREADAPTGRGPNAAATSKAPR